MNKMCFLPYKNTKFQRFQLKFYKSIHRQNNTRNIYFCTTNFTEVLHMLPFKKFQFSYKDDTNRKNKSQTIIRLHYTGNFF